MATKTKRTRKEIEKEALKRQKELEKTAQDLAYSEVPTQEEMLHGGEPVCDKKPHPGANPEVTGELDEFLYEAAQEGNIGGG